MILVLDAGAAVRVTMRIDGFKPMEKAITEAK